MMQSNPNECFTLNILFHSINALQMLDVIYKHVFPHHILAQITPKFS